MVSCFSDGCQGQTAVSSITELSLTPTEVSPQARVPTGFNMDDFLFSKLFKSIKGEGERTVNEILRPLFRQRIPEESSDCTLGQILSEKNYTIFKNLLKENPLTAKFNITCGISLLLREFHDIYKALSEHCQAQIRSLGELKNSLSLNYPLLDFEGHDTELNNLLQEKLEFVTLVNEIKELKEKKEEFNADEEKKKIQGSIDEKRREIYVIFEIEKLRVILNDILENVSCVLKKDFTDCKSIVNKNLTDIIRAKAEQYDQDTYDRDVSTFKNDPMFKLITKGREELKNQYRRLKIANPCPWIIMDQYEELSINNFSIEKIYTPLRIEGSRNEISTENLLATKKESNHKTVMPPALVLHGLAGSGKTTLCLHFLHHWTEGKKEIKTLKDYSLVIYVELRTVKSNSIVSYLRKQRMKESTSTLDITDEDLVQQLNDLKLLFILDGYDEAKSEFKKIVRNIFAKFPNQGILVTTRTEFRDEVISMCRIQCSALEICGFDESRIDKFTEKVFNAVKQSNYFIKKKPNATNSNEFRQYVRGRGRILKKHLELPLTLALMIYMWIDCPEVLNNVTTCTSLYYELFKLCQKKIKNRLTQCTSEENLEQLLILIGKKAWQLLRNEEDLLSNEDEKEIDEECRKRKVPKEELLSAFLMYEVDSKENRYDYSFMHRTQMEYLSAFYLAEKAEKKSLHEIDLNSSLARYHQIIIFLVGHLTRKKMLNKKLHEVFEVLAEAMVGEDNFNFWWRLLTESHIDGNFNGNLSSEIAQKMLKKKWKLTQDNVVSGLELLIATPVQIEELVIDIESGIDPYDIKDFYCIMKSLKRNLRDRYGKNNPIITELFFWQHCTSCGKPSNDLLATLFPWGHLSNFVGSVGKYPEGFMLDYCFKVKNLRVRVESVCAVVSLSRSLKLIQKSIRNLRVILAVKPEECDPNGIACLTFQSFSGKFELTLLHMKNEHENWIVQVVKNISTG